MVNSPLGAHGKVFREHPEGKETFFVPKFHLPTHIAQCQTAYSFNLMPGVGCTDGVAPEPGWANINPVAAQTKQMVLSLVAQQLTIILVIGIIRRL